MANYYQTLMYSFSSWCLPLIWLLFSKMRLLIFFLLWGLFIVAVEGVRVYGLLFYFPFYFMPKPNDNVQNNDWNHYHILTFFICCLLLLFCIPFFCVKRTQNVCFGKTLTHIKIANKLEFQINYVCMCVELGSQMKHISQLIAPFSNIVQALFNVKYMRI